MILSPSCSSSRAFGLPRERLVLILAALLLLAAFFVPQTALACDATAGGGPVWYEGCTEEQDTGGAGTIAAPAGTAAGDTLVLTIVADGSRTITSAPAASNVTWTLLNGGADQNSQVSYFVYGGTVTGVPGTTSLTVSGGTVDWLATMMRFTGSQGWVGGEIASSTGAASTNTPAPSITTALNNSLILRMGGFDDDDFLTRDAATIINGYRTISQWESADQRASAAHVFVDQGPAGSTGAADFLTIPTLSEDWRTVTLALRPYMLCTGTNAVPSGGEVEYAGCEQKSAVDTTSVTVTTPAATTIGNYLLAVVATDGDTSGSIAAPAGWSVIDVGAGAGTATTLAVFGRAADADGAQDHVFTWTGNQDAFAYIMRFTGTDGVDAADVASATATGANVSTPSFTTALADTLVVRIGAFDNNLVDLNPTTIISGHNNITQGRSSGDTANSVSSAAAWINQAGAGATGTALFSSAPTASEETRTVTLGLRPRPAHFRIVHSGSATTCAPQTITLTRYFGNGSVNTTYTGTVQLGTNSMNGAWAIGNGTGTLTSGPGDGTATYTFGAGDNGTVDLQFMHASAATVNIDVADGSITESAGFDPDLSVTACNGNATLFQQVCSDTSNSVNTVNLPPDDGNRLVLVTVHRTGNMGNPPPTGSMTFGGVGMTLMQEAEINSGNADLQAQMWGLLDSSLPGGTGPFTVTAQAIGTTRLCVFVYQNMDQSALPTAPTDANSATATISGLDIETDVTTAVNNALVLSAASARIASGTRSWSDPPDADLATRNWSGNSANLSFGVSSGIIASPGVVTVTEAHDGASSDRRGQVLATLRPLPRTLNHFRITHGGSGGTCGPNDVTITAIDQYGDVLTTYTGTITLSAEGVGDWIETTANGTLLNGAADDGAATYQFSALDAGAATLQYSDNAFDSSKNFNVNDGAVTESAFFDPRMNFANCVFRITHAAANGATCAPNSVTIGAYTAGGVAMPGYTGTVTLATVLVPGPGSGGGDWSVGDGQGAFDNGTANDGLATYTFVAADAGEVTLLYSKTAAATVNFNITATGMSVDAGYDPNLVLTNCFYRISHDANADVCTPEAITITVVSGTGVTQTGYVGTVNITTATNVGDWSTTSALGTLNNTGSGAASYTFHDDDNGVAVLYLMHHSTSASVNINLNSGSFQEQAGYDPSLAVAGCTIRFSLSSVNATTCTNTTVTLGIYNSGGTLATSYAGAVDLTTSTSHGTWLSADGAGLVDSNPGNGTGTYTFAGSEGGDVALVFTSDDVEDLNFNATANSGTIVVDTGSPTYDPDLDISACLPTVFDSACYANASQANAISLQSEAETQGSRMVLMYVGSTSTTSATGASINGTAMTLLRTEAVNSGGGTLLQVYGLLDTNLPDNAGDYAAAFTGSANSPAMCIVALSGAAQQFPQEATPATSGQLNGTNLVNTDPIITSLTTNQNNSIVVGVALNSQGGTTYSSNLETTLWQAGTADPASADWAGFSGYQLAAGTLNVESQVFGTPNRQVQIALAVAPIVTGPPAVTGYVPVTLYESFSGNVNYRAIGNTLRAEDNGGNTCAMFDINTGSTATMSLPTGSTIMAAYLYWAGSGYEADADPDVFFGVDGSPSPVSADEIFIIEPDLPSVPEGFFAAYKDVTGLVSTSTSTTYRFYGLDVRTDPPWDDYATCLGGWALVVVYENSGEPLNVINLFHGFQPFYYSAFTLVPRNFRMATPDGVSIPHAQVTHITFEGDPDLTGADEVIGLQNTPSTLSFTNLTNNANPADDQYNSTVTFPTYDINLDWTGTYSESSVTWGTDVDTYYVEGDDPGEVIYPFGQLEAEQITTRYSTSEDYVLLVGEFISVNNAPIADLEIFITDGGTWKVGSNGAATYTYSVTNNGNGAASGGFASGDVIVTGNMPNGVSFDPNTDIAAPGWDCSLATTTAFTCVLEITEAGVGSITDGELDMGEFLPDIVVTVDIADDAVFTQLNNDITTVARLAHVGEYYAAACQGQNEPAGVQPSPNPVSGCSKSPQFDNVDDLNKYLVDIDDLDEKSVTNNNVHDNTRNVRGIETNLSMNKSVAGILETNEPAVYQLSVQNLGPDANTKTITVTDTLPAGLVPLTATGTNWSCAIAGQAVTCTRTSSFPVASGGTAPAITIMTAGIAPPAVEGVFVSNTATVSIGTGNFDTVPANNSDTDITEVTGPLAAATERFLISVTEDGSTLGGLTFDDGDLVLYDPVTGVATMFLDASTLTGGDTLQNVDAVHLLPNGHVIMSTTTDGASIGGVTFNAEDLVLYDPILKTATLVFDGSAIFASDTSDIDAVHVIYNASYSPADWDIIISTTGTATIGALTFQDNDIVSYDVSAGLATLLEDGNDDDLFGGTAGDVSALYLRYDDANKYILSTSDEDVTIGSSGEQLSFERGELVEIDLTTADDPLTDPLFCDDQTPCVGSPPAIFTPASLTRRLDAVHVIETGYFGHFAITIVAGDTCSATTVTIRKHAGLTHATETEYRGSIRITNSANDGTWFKVAGAGTLTAVGVDSGEAVYTFQAADNGEVVLSITGVAATNSFSVNVSNTLVVENSPSEDPTAPINDLITPITYRDEFNVVAYTANNGAAAFASPWSETNDDGSAAAGDIRVMSGQLRFNNFGGGTGPALAREIDFSGYTVAVTPSLSFDYTISGSPSGTFLAEVSIDGGGWTTLWSTGASSGSGNSGTLAFPGTPGSDAQIRFRIASGYSTNAAEFMYIDNVQVATQTTDCGAGSSLDHYSITTASNTLVSCLAAEVTISPHTITDILTEPGAGVMISLSATTVPPSVTKGTWGPPAGGAGNFVPGTPGDGTATYTYALGEDALTFPFYYTNLATNSETVTFSVTDSNVPSSTNNPGETATITVSKAGLRFFNETASSEQFPTLVAGAPSNIYPANVLTIQAVKVSETDPTVCEAYFDGDVTADVELAFECINPDNCSATVNPVAVTNNGNTELVEPVDDNGSAATVNTGSFVSMPLQFTSNGSFSRAVIALNYADAGSLQIHGRHNILVEGGDQDGARDEASGDFMEGVGDTFVVRPFAFDIDFTNDRALNGNDNDAQSWATTASKSPAFMTAGEPFNATVRAVLWECLDDDPAATDCTSPSGGSFDGVPAEGADLYFDMTTMSGNRTTPNFGKEIGAAEAELTLSWDKAAAMPVSSVVGTLSGVAFNAFDDPNNDDADGEETHAIEYDEVGIIDLFANLDSGDYLGGGEGITGSLLNVGRFIPADFEITAPALIPRVNVSGSTSPFTYMGEDFGVNFTLTARNADGNPVVNYDGAFARLQPGDIEFFAIQDLSGKPTPAENDDVDLSARLEQSVNNPLPNDFSASWDGGTLTLATNLVFKRQLTEVEDGPYRAVTLAMRVTDPDMVFDVDRNVDDDDGTTEPGTMLYRRLGTSDLDFLYGRLRLENAYGSEIPELDTGNAPVGRDVAVMITAEYWDGENFVRNDVDEHTPYASAALGFVPNSYNFEGDYPEPDNLDAGEAVITPGIDGILHEGGTYGVRPLLFNDTPLFLQAPGEDNRGTVLLELDLGYDFVADPQKDGSLNFLRYDWRGATTQPEAGDIDPDGVQDYPRALVEFGTFRGNDRIINWQELFE